MASKLWLPKGYHSGLHFEHAQGGDAGFFTGGGWKLCWHITVSPWVAIDSMVNVLRTKGAEPHLVIGGRAGLEHPVVVQMVPFNRAGRSLRHTLPQETNRANCIQVEICATPGSAMHLAAQRMGAGSDRHGHDLFALPGAQVEFERALGLTPESATDADFPICMSEDQYPEALVASFRAGVASWGDDTYNALATLARYVEHRIAVPRKLARRFTNTSRFTGQGFVNTKGHLGHMHAPGNDHIDPTVDFKGSHLLRLMNEQEG